MKSNPEQFEDLLQLLALKRHEQPPPAYFDDFPNAVMGRISRLSKRQPQTLWQELWAALVLKPVWVGAYGLAVCSLVLFSFSVSQIVGTESAQIPLDTLTLSVMPAAIPGAGWSSRAPLSPVELLPSSVSPVMPEEANAYRFEGMVRKASLSRD